MTTTGGPPETAIPRSPPGCAADEQAFFEAEALFEEARRRRNRRRLTVAGALFLTLAGTLAGYEAAQGGTSADTVAVRVPVLASPSHPASFAAACAGVARGALTALSASGRVVVVDAASGKVAGVLATGAAPRGGLALDRRGVGVFVTGRGADGLPSVWSLRCDGEATEVAGNAELPALSSDGAVLGWVTLDASGRQSGVAIATLGSDDRVGRPRMLRSPAVPPAAPIREIALGPHGDELAVWGGLITRGLGGGRITTTSSLAVRRARSLATLEPINTSQFSIVRPLPRRLHPAGTRAAVYLPSGLMLLAAGRTGIEEPFTVKTSGEQGGGVRSIVRGTGRVESLAAGPGGGVAWVTSSERLETTPAAWDLPFGWADGPYTPPQATVVVGRWRAVAWTAGSGRLARAVPPVFAPVVLPDVVGMNEHAAVQVLDKLVVPSYVASVAPDLAVPPDTVTSESPPAGTNMACECAVSLSVSSGGSPVTASAPTGTSS